VPASAITPSFEPFGLDPARAGIAALASDYRLLKGRVKRKKKTAGISPTVSLFSL